MEKKNLMPQQAKPINRINPGADQLPYPLGEGSVVESALKFPKIHIPVRDTFNKVKQGVKNTVNEVGDTFAEMGKDIEEARKGVNSVVVKVAREVGEAVADIEEDIQGAKGDIEALTDWAKDKAREKYIAKIPFSEEAMWAAREAACVAAGEGWGCGQKLCAQLDSNSLMRDLLIDHVNRLGAPLNLFGTPKGIKQMMCDK